MAYLRRARSSNCQQLKQLKQFANKQVWFISAALRVRHVTQSFAREELPWRGSRTYEPAISSCVTSASPKRNFANPLPSVVVSMEARGVTKVRQRSRAHSAVKTLAGGSTADLVARGDVNLTDRSPWCREMILADCEWLIDAYLRLRKHRASSDQRAFIYLLSRLLSHC